MKVSVIAGIYNPPKELFEKFLNSCLNTTLDCCEFILVQDSPDDVISNQTLKEYEERFKQNKNDFVILKNDKNLGIIKTYNIGMSYAKGEYLAFFDSDDWFDEDFIETLYTYAKNNNSDVVSGYSITHFVNKNDFPAKIMESSNNDIWVNLFKKKTLVDNYIPYTDDPSVVFASLNRVITPKMDRIPLEMCTFYHYMRHDNNISQYTTEDIGKNINEYFSNIEENLNSIKHKCNVIFKEN